MSIQISPNLPANVVEIGQEISQAKIDELNAGIVATQAWVSANAATIAYLQSNYQPLSGMTVYLTIANAASTYAPLARAIPAGGTAGQVLTKVNGTDYSLTWTTPSASASLTWGSITGTLSNQTDLNTALNAKANTASPTFTGTVTIPAGASISGYLTSATAASTYQTQAGMSSYLTTASASSTYQTISGMSSYLTISSASATYAPKANPTFTGTVTIPAGASISGYLTTASAASTYQTISNMSFYLTTANAASTYQTLSGMSSYLTTSSASSTYLTQANAATTYQLKTDMASYMTIGALESYNFLTVSGAAATYQPIGSYITEAPVDGQEYVRKNAAWSVATSGGGGGGGVAWGAITGTVTNQTDLVTYIAGLGYLTSIPSKTVQSVGAGYLVSAGDQNKILLFTTTMGGDTINLPADSTYAFPDGTEITICQYSGVYGNGISGQYAGQPTINGASSVTVSTTVSKLVKIATDTWLYT